MGLRSSRQVVLLAVVFSFWLIPTTLLAACPELSLVNHGVQEVEDGWKVIAGEAANYSDKDLTSVELTFAFYRDSGDSDTTTIRKKGTLPAGGSWQFKAPAFIDFTDYKLAEKACHGKDS